MTQLAPVAHRSAAVGSRAAALWVVIPAFNEVEVIAGVVADLLARQACTVVVVDDCSTDGTGSAACAAGATVLRHAINLGQGAALQTGIRYALAGGASLIATFDADGQHRSEDIAALLEMQRRIAADVVLGSRFLGSTQGLPAARKWLLKAAVCFTWLTAGVRLSDAHNGLRLLTRAAAARVCIRQNRMAHASELISQFRSLGLRFVEAPVTVRYTAHSLRKGQRLSGALVIVADLIVGRLSR